VANGYITIKGAREHNLKNLDVSIPRNKLVVITGLSGSGKSSLAFDTIYAEGQRRYVESLSAYARQFLGLMEKPDVDFIDGLSPAISIEQRSSAKNPRSTVGTVTEIYDYLRLLFARIGIPHCFNCGERISQQTSSQIVDTVMSLPEKSRIQILAPLVRGRKGEHRDVLDEVVKEGFVRIRIDGEVYHVDELPQLDKKKKHSIEIVVDRLVRTDAVKKRLADSVETALKISSGIVLIDVIGDKELVFSEKYACIKCGISYEELSPRMFSFNSPYGACAVCGGLGNKMEIDPTLIVPDERLAISQGAIHPWGSDISNWHRFQLRGVSEHYGFKFGTPWKQISEKVRKIIMLGSGKTEIKFKYEHAEGRGKGEYVGKFEGVIPNLERRYKQTESAGIRSWIEQYMSIKPCPLCNGARLRRESLAVTVHRKSIHQVTRMSVKDAKGFFNDLKLTKRESTIAHQVLKEIKERLGFLSNVGLDYLTLERAASSLSGGEAQRIRLATQIGSRLVGVLYILDEPSVGLHQRDNGRLLATLTDLRDLGNSVIVVEHDRETIESADYVIDLGPGAGKRGGEIIAKGTPTQLKRSGKSLTGKFLARKLSIKVPGERRPGNEQPEENRCFGAARDIHMCHRCVRFRQIDSHKRDDVSRTGEALLWITPRASAAP
jgi:excinuclease ABC subunit A